MRARVQAGGGEPFGGQARQPRAGVVQDQRTFGQPTGLAPARTRAGRPAPDRAARAAAPGRPWAAGAAPPGPRPACRQPAAARSPARSARPPAHRCGGGRAPAFQRLRQQVGDGPVDAPSLTRPSSPWTWRCTSSSAWLASASRRRARASRVSPMAVGAPARVRVSSAAPTCASRSATCRLMVGGARCRRARRWRRSPGRRWRPGAQPVQADFPHDGSLFRKTESGSHDIRL